MNCRGRVAALRVSRYSLLFSGAIVALALDLVSLAGPRTIPRPAAAAGPTHVGPSLACSPDRSVAEPRQRVRLTAYIAAPRDGDLRFAWTAEAGQVDGRGAEAFWDLSDVPARAAPYTAQVQVSDSSGRSLECSVQMIVRRRQRRASETGSAFLERTAREAEGYGLYSYLLLSTPPSDGTRERYVQVLTEYLRQLPNITELELFFERRHLNISYIPVKIRPETPPSPEWVLENYDYARGRVLLSRVPGGSRRDGPYIVSHLSPLNGQPGLAGPFLYQDLSAVPPHLIGGWVREFLNQAAQERYWEIRSAAHFSLKLRMTIGIMAEGLPPVQKALDGWITWGREH